MKLHMNLDEHSYDIILERGCLKQLRNYIDVNHKILIISDDNVLSQRNVRNALSTL